MALRESTLAIEGPLLVSRPLKMPLLLSEEEMRDLLITIGCTLYHAQGVVPKGGETLSYEDFLAVYGAYVSALREGQEPKVSPQFSLFLSIDESLLYAIPVEGGVIVKATRPIIMLQPHSLTYSDGEFHSLTYGQNTLPWGLQFSYPTLFQDAKTHEVADVKEEFANTAPFKQLQRWVRQNTIATPFVVDGKRVNVPVRLGKACLPWINNHPGLQARKIHVHCR